MSVRKKSEKTEQKKTSSIHAQNLIRAFRKARFDDLMGDEVLALSAAMNWLIKEHFEGKPDATVSKTNR